MSDATGFKIRTTEPAEHDLTTPRGRLLYLRDVVVPGIPAGQINMLETDCGTAACLLGWYLRDKAAYASMKPIAGVKPGQRDYAAMVLGSGEETAIFGVTARQSMHLFTPKCGMHPTHAELRAHIDDVLEGRVR